MHVRELECHGIVVFFPQNKIQKRKTFKFFFTLSVKHFVSFYFNLDDYCSQHMKMKKHSPSKYQNIMEKFNISSHILHISIYTVLRKSSNHNDGISDLTVVSHRRSLLKKLSKHIHGKVTGREKCGRKWYIINREDRRLERTDKQS